MAHHQHHGTMHFTPTSLSTSPQHMSHTMPAISEDEHTGEADEPPEHPLHSFQKTTPPTMPRRPSLLTKALHTDSESHDESLGFSTAFKRQTSRSSTCSTWSLRTDPPSDDAMISSPSSPTRPVLFQKPHYEAPKIDDKTSKLAESLDPKTQQSTSPGQTSEPVEEKLGRKRCITFACGRQKPEADQSLSKSPEPRKPVEKPATPPKRPCALKFVCPSKVSADRPEPTRRPSRHLSPPPPTRTKSPCPKSSRIHRDSDTTIKNESPKTSKKLPPLEARRSSIAEPEEDVSEASRFHEFACPDDNVDDWVQESTCHRSRLTVDDTLQKEKNIRQIGEEAEEEALEEEEIDDALSGPVDSDDDDDISDAGFQTDDEEGFAESDEEDDGDSDYEWWAAGNRSSPIEATMAPGDALRLPAMHTGSPSSLSSVVSPKRKQGLNAMSKGKKKSKTGAIPIRIDSPELPDSTDFVCGTLDEDKPLEQEYASCIERRRAAKHFARPQDIDPTFPEGVIDPDDEEDDDDVVDRPPSDESDHGFHGVMENIDGKKTQEVADDELRGRRRDPKPKPSPRPSPLRLQSSTPRNASVKRVKSPMPGSKMTLNRPKSPMPSKSLSSADLGKSNAQKKGQKHRSPAPRALFGHSPRRGRSPPAPTTLESPPPSRLASPENGKQIPFGTAFLGQRPQLTHTTSLPRSPNPFAFKRAPFVRHESTSAEESSSDDGEDTARENKGYNRGAIDIVQGLERKRLRRRQKFYEKYQRKEEKKFQRGEVRRPAPGKGAQRMKQVGIGCAVYRGKRVLSV